MQLVIVIILLSIYCTSCLRFHRIFRLGMNIDPLEESRTGSRQILPTPTVYPKKVRKDNYIIENSFKKNETSITYITSSQVLDQFLYQCKILVPQISILAIVANGLILIPLLPFIKFKLGL